MRTCKRETVGLRATISAIISSAFFLSGCDDLLPSKGTTIGYSNCFHAIKQQNLTDNTAKLYCTLQIQVQIQNQIKGYANYDTTDGKITSFSGSVINDGSENVITAYQITISTESGKFLTKKFKSLFLEPGDSSGFVINSEDLAGKFAEDDFKDSSGKYTYHWAVDELLGLAIRQSGMQ